MHFHPQFAQHLFEYISIKLYVCIEKPFLVLVICQLYTYNQSNLNY